jgi:AraC family transcriptional regulator of adaptative response/methylated-DNA-[protein]-cysteine methyltransferase
MSDADTDCRAVAAAITVLATHEQERPNQERPTPATVATAVGLDPAGFEALFRRWTGVGLERFLEHLPLADAPALRARSRPGVATPATPSPLTITVWPPGRTPAAPVIRWGRHPSPFGPVLAAAAEPGLCRLGFDGDAAEPERLAADWPNARLVEDAAATREAVAYTFSTLTPSEAEPPLPVLLRGTPFQVAVWQALLAIPPGAVVSYQDVATAIGRPKAVRAVGGAVGANPIAVLIPCHRVILASGTLHQYGWGPPRKRALLAWERAWTTG